MFVVIDPFGLAPLFVALTQGMSDSARRSIGIRACVIAAVILSLFALIGEQLLGFIGISMPRKIQLIFYIVYPINKYITCSFTSFIIQLKQ